LLWIEVVVEDSYDVLVKDPMKKLYLARESREQLLPMSFGVRDVLLANEMLVDLIVVQ
jgi:hypothetical protein